VFLLVQVVRLQLVCTSYADGQVDVHVPVRVDVTQFIAFSSIVQKDFFDVLNVAALDVEIAAFCFALLDLLEPLLFLIPRLTREVAFRVFDLLKLHVFVVVGLLVFFEEFLNDGVLVFLFDVVHTLETGVADVHAVDFCAVVVLVSEELGVAAVVAGVGVVLDVHGVDLLVLLAQDLGGVRHDFLQHLLLEGLGFLVDLERQFHLGLLLVLGDQLLHLSREHILAFVRLEILFVLVLGVPELVVELDLVLRVHEPGVLLGGDFLELQPVLAELRFDGNEVFPVQVKQVAFEFSLGLIDSVLVEYNLYFAEVTATDESLEDQPFLGHEVDAPLLHEKHIAGYLPDLLDFIVDFILNGHQEWCKLDHKLLGLFEEEQKLFDAAVVQPQTDLVLQIERQFVKDVVLLEPHLVCFA